MELNQARIPLFPIGAVVFPGEQLPLHIFEERYKQMVAYCLERGVERRSAPFGIILGENGEVKGVGCSVTITRVLERYGDGRLDILTVGERRFTVLDLHRERLFTEGTVQYFDDTAGEPVDRILEHRAVALQGKILELVKKKTPNLQMDQSTKASFVLGHFAGLKNEERQHFIEIRSENQRLQYLVDHYEKILPVVLERDDLKALITMNGQVRKLASMEL